MFFRTKTYLKFLWQSFHLHGIHSPFVFQLSQECFKNKDKVFPCLTEHLKIDSVLFFGNSSEPIFKNTEITVLNPMDIPNLNLILEENRRFDLVYFPVQIEKNLIPLFKKVLPVAHNDSIFVFENPHRSKDRGKNWDRIKQEEKVRVSIDTFHFGLLFFRKEQVKEDFFVRVG
ncbi:MAG TPA: hypothetical protein VFM82_11800 [Flavobacteriaceae bacterium]|nr:hypothetical protein [Flavobacteriaceae bacterium]